MGLLRAAPASVLRPNALLPTGPTISVCLAAPPYLPHSASALVSGLCVQMPDARRVLVSSVIWGYGEMTVLEHAWWPPHREAHGIKKAVRSPKWFAQTLVGAHTSCLE